MELRPARPSDLDAIQEIDATLEHAQYLHVEQSGEGLASAWRLEPRPLRNRSVEPNRLNDDIRFTLRQILQSIEEGLVIVAEHDGILVASLASIVQPENRTLKVVDLRVDYDYRRQGLGLSLLFRAIQEARERELRAVMAQTRTNNLPAANLLLKAGFEPSGLDLRLHSNHDLVKEAVTLFWYAALD